MSKPEREPRCFSYRRFSRKPQEEGDSLRRQTVLAEEWAARNNVPLDKSLVLEDRGVSAFLGVHRSNPDRYALAAFLHAVEKKRVHPGDYLVVENLDRLTREHLLPAMSLCLNIITSGIKLVQLSPVEMVFDENTQPAQLMMMIMELSRAHSESAEKSRRLAEAWMEKRRRARAEGEKLSDRRPAWVEKGEQGFYVPQDRANTLLLIFELAAAGYGLDAIARKLTKDGVPCFGPSGKWWTAYLRNILRGRAVLGEHQPCGKGRKPDGPPIPDYYPSVISEDLWKRVQSALTSRERKRGRLGNHVNLFSHLLIDARNGCPMYAVGVTAGKGGYRVYRPRAAWQGGCDEASFRVEVLEKELLDRLAEINQADVLASNDQADELEHLMTEREANAEEIAKAKAGLSRRYSDTLADVVAQREERQRELDRLIAEASERLANPTTEAWSETRTLSSLLASASDQTDVRLRLRAVLRRVIAEIRLLVIPRGRDRLAVAQVWFVDGIRSRSYIIYHRPPWGSRYTRRDGAAWSESFRGHADHDLRDPNDVRLLERDLRALDF